MFHNFCNSFSDDGLRRFYFFFLTKYQVFHYFLCSIKTYSLDINYFSNLIWDVNYFVESNLQWGGRRSPNTTLAPNLRKTGDGIWSKSGAFVPFESKSFTFKTYFCLLELEKTVYFLPNNIVVLLRTWVRFFLGTFGRAWPFGSFLYALKPRYAIYVWKESKHFQPNDYFPNNLSKL